MATKHASASFRPTPKATDKRRPSRWQLAGLLATVIVVALGVSIASLLVKPSKARAFNFFYGSVFLNDTSSPVGVDLASGKPTVRLANPTAPVTAATVTQVNVLSLAGGNTLMLNSATGEFNMVDPTGFVIKTSAGGVTLPNHGPTTAVTAVAAGSSAYIVQETATSAYVYLVNAATVASSTTTADRKSAARAYAQINSSLASPDLRRDLASANGGLWLLTNNGAGRRAVTELEVPPQSNSGATLSQTPHGYVQGPAAIESATVNKDGTGADVVGVASRNSIRVFPPTGEKGAAKMDLGVQIAGTVDEIIPVSDATGSLVFLYHSLTDGWNLVAASADGTGKAGVVPLDKPGEANAASIDPNAQLTAPAESNGRTYVVNKNDDRSLWQLDASGAQPVPHAALYPKEHKTKFVWTDPEVIARGNRVVFNNPDSRYAVVVFSDNSRRPRILDKHVAVAVDPAGATALINAHIRHTNKAATSGEGTKNDTPPRDHAPPAKTPPQAVDNRVDCSTVRQVPHTPTLSATQQASRSIEFHWIYPTPDATDCEASTYRLKVTTETPDSPDVSFDKTIQGNVGITVGGLYPSTVYKAELWAYINGIPSNGSVAMARTGPEGPQAPTNVRGAADSSGNWDVSWNSCGGIAQACVQTTSWTVIPSFCDHLAGLYSNPDKLTIVADPTEHSFHAVYPGNDALLGRALCFQVQGTSPGGTIGDISDSTAPAYSWRPPVAGAFHLTASRPPSTNLGASASTDLTLDLGANPIRDVGGIGATVTFLLHGPNGTQTSNATVTGRSSQISANFPGIRPGQHYTAQARVSAPGHPEASVMVNGGTVTTRANWPQLGLSAACPSTDPDVRLSCLLSLRISGISSATSDGERFSLGGNSYLRCGETYQYLHQTNFDPSVTAITTPIDLLSNLHGLCSVSLQLVEGANQADPPVFGGTVSPTITQSIDLGHATTLGATAGDFTASFSNTDGASVDLAYTGRFAHDDVAKITTGWHEQIYAPDGTPCGGDSAGQGGQPEVFIDVKPFECILDHGNQTGWTVTVSYGDAGTSNRHVFDRLSIPGTPPGYIPPCAVDTTNFDAQWSGTFDNPSVTLGFTPGGAVLDGCSNWSYQVNWTNSAGSSGCGGASTPLSQLPISIGVSGGCDVDSGQWNVGISFTSARTGDHAVYVQVTGEAPQPPPTTPPPPTTEPPSSSLPPTSSSPTDTPSPTESSTSPTQ